MTTAAKAGRFLLIGLLGLALYWAGATALTALAHWPASLAHVAAYLACIGPIYVLQHGFAFRADTSHAYSAPRYVLVQLMNVAIGAVLSPALVQLGLHSWAVFAVVGVVNSGFGFAAQLIWTFRSPSGRRGV